MANWRDGKTVVTTSGCLVWTGATNPKGYGKVYYNGRHWRVHRLAWQERWGKIPEGVMVCHKCDVRNCLNDEHLFLSDAAGNFHDMTAKGKGPAKLGMADVVEIARKLAGGQSGRSLAKEYGVSERSILSIKRRQWWKWLLEKLDEVDGNQVRA